MSNIYDKILVVDVESTCWEGHPPAGYKSEIIEIGIAELDLKDGTIGHNEGIIIRPAQSKVSKFCTDLTTLTQEQVDKGVSFKEACIKLEKEYRSHDRVWGSYGDYDRKMFERNCKDFGVKFPFGSTHYNIKSLVALVKGLNKEVGMPGALELFGLELAGTHHRGMDDAFNIAHIFACALGKPLK